MKTIRITDDYSLYNYLVVSNIISFCETTYGNTRITMVNGDEFVAREKLEEIYMMIEGDCR